LKITGFTFIRNALTYDYPIVEAINSILPICDEFVVAVGNSSDETLQLIQQIDAQKIRIIETVWDDSLREAGRVLAVETDKAFAAISEDSDWAFYIQGDEVVHEKYLDAIYKAMLQFKDDKNVDGLLFKYLHFYGSYDYVGVSSRWYKHEIRVVRKNKAIYSYRDAQGFRKGNNEKLRVKEIDAYIYHYGWVKPPAAMQRKQEVFHKLWHDDNWVEQHVAKVEEYDYSGIDALTLFTDTHPKVMQARIAQKNWIFAHDISFNRLSLKEKLKIFTQKYLGWDMGQYKNYLKV
jgi:glycosyltransferase involved in cell wall biosynthesis